MATESTEMSLLSGMDSLWFYHAILFSNNSLFIVPKKLFLPTSQSLNCSSKSCSQMISEQELSPLASITTGSQDQTSSQESDHDKKYVKHENRPTRLNLVSSKTRYHHSSSPLTSSARRKSRKPGQGRYSAMRLQKTMSCKSLGELELEEVKGFTDLGFDFKKEKLSKQLMRLIPGLQRIDNSDNDEDEEEKGAMRPYLSEAWFVKMSDSYSPLMNTRVERVYGNEDMKKHLKCWARTVALAIQQGS